jgi:hypothetical protein
MEFVSSDPFVGKLLEPFSTNTIFWLSMTSDNRIVKFLTPGNDMFKLEDIITKR